MPAKKFKFPTAFTVLAIILLLVWIASFFVPPGTYDTDSSGSPKPGTYHELPDCSAPASTAISNNDSATESGQAPADSKAAPGATVAEAGLPCQDKSFKYRFKQLWDAPPNGLYGVESKEGFVGPSEEGFLYGSAAIFLFVLAVGAFITVTMKTEAIQTGIGRLAVRFRHSGSVLIAILMTVFAIGGTTYGMWEETLGFFVLLVPLALALGYDRMVAASIIFLGAGTGVIASTVNPFSTGVASDAAGITVGDGIGLRIALWLVLVPMAIGYVLWYARRIRLHPEKSVVGVSPSDATEAQSLVTDVPALTARQKLVLALFGATFLVMIYGFVPWHDLWQEGWGRDFPLPTFGDFYFAEAAALFFVMAVVIGLIARLGEEGTVTTIIAGASDFLAAGHDHRVGAGHHRGDEERLHDGHDPARDGTGGLGQLERHLRNPGVHRQPAHRLSRTVLVRPRRARDADPCATRWFRRRLQGHRSHLFPDGLGPRESRDPYLRRDHGWTCALEGRLRPLLEVCLAVPAGGLCCRLRVRRHCCCNGLSP